MDFSPHSALRASLTMDLNLSLKNRGFSEPYPFITLITLLFVFLSIACSMFLKDGDQSQITNGLGASAVTTFITWWTTFVFSAFILVLFGLSAPERYLHKAVYVTLSAVMTAVLLLSINLIIYYPDVTWIGLAWSETWQTAAAGLYTLPYMVYCLIRSFKNLTNRTKKIEFFLDKKQKQGQTENTQNNKEIDLRISKKRTRLSRIKIILFAKAAFTFLSIIVFAASMLSLTVIDDDSIAAKLFNGLWESLPKTPFST